MHSYFQLISQGNIFVHIYFLIVLVIDWVKCFFPLCSWRTQCKSQTFNLTTVSLLCWNMFYCMSGFSCCCCSGLWMWVAELELTSTGKWRDSMSSGQKAEEMKSASMIPLGRLYQHYLFNTFMSSFPLLMESMSAKNMFFTQRKRNRKEDQSERKTNNWETRKGIQKEEEPIDFM